MAIQMQQKPRATGGSGSGLGGLLKAAGAVAGFAGKAGHPAAG